MPRTLLDKRRDRYEKIGKLLAGAVGWKNMTYDEIGQILGLERRAAGRYLKNPERMTVEKLLKLSRALNIPIDELRQSIQY